MSKSHSSYICEGPNNYKGWMALRTRASGKTSSRISSEDLLGRCAERNLQSKSDGCREDELRYEC